MPKLIAVDFDPFEQVKRDQPTLTPIDFDPFEDIHPQERFSDQEVLDQFNQFTTDQGGMVPGDLGEPARVVEDPDFQPPFSGLDQVDGGQLVSDMEAEGLTPQNSFFDAILNARNNQEVKTEGQLYIDEQKKLKPQTVIGKSTLKQKIKGLEKKEKERKSFLENALRGAGERAGDVGGALLETAETLGEGLESSFPAGGFVWEDGDVLPSYKTPEEFAQNDAPKILSKGASVLKNIDLGYEERVDWENVKKEFSEKGVLSGSAYANVVEYAFEQGIKSTPDMVAAMFSLPAYVIARSGEIGEQRALNKGKDKTEVVDILEAAPFAIASSLLERIGAKGMTSDVKAELGQEMFKAGIKEASKRVVKAGGKALAKEAATEALQEGMVEYVGERYGTKASMDFNEALDRAAGAAVAGGIFGGGVGSNVAIANEIRFNPKKDLGKQLLKDIDEAQPIASAREVAVERFEPTQKVSLTPVEGIKEADFADLPPSIVEEKQEITPIITPEETIPVPKVVKKDDEIQEVGEVKIDNAAQEAATSNENDIPEPTQSQIEAGNYKKGHLSLHGLDIAIENPRGSERKGTDSDGETWSVTMKNHYGYIKKTEGADGDHVDVFVNEKVVDKNVPVFVVNQVDPKTKEFDEHKVMMGFASEPDARKGYLENYASGWKGIGSIKKFTVDEFKTWLSEGDTKKPILPKTLPPQTKERKLTSPKKFESRQPKVDDKKIYHGTSEKFEDFDLSKSADGTVWFTDNIEKIKGGEVAASGKGQIMERTIDESRLKLGGWEETDKYSTDELIQQGYDGLKLPDGDEITYQIFKPGKLGKPPKKLSSKSPVLDAPGAKHQPMYQSSDTQGYERPESGVVQAGKRKIKIPTEDKAVRRESIRASLIDIIGNRLYEGKVKGKGRLGFYSPQNSEIRIKRYGDVEVMAHEMAHYLDFHRKEKNLFKKAYKHSNFSNEIKDLSYTTDKKVVSEEGFAEYVRLWLTKYPEAQAQAPKFTAKFEEILNSDKALNKKMLILQEKMHQWYYQGSDARLSAVMDGNKLSNKEKIKQALSKKPSAIMKQKMVDHIHAAKVIEREVHGKLLDATESGYKQLQLINGIEGIFAESTKSGAPYIASDGSIDFRGPSLNSIFRSSIVSGSKVFKKHQKYFVARRAQELKEQGRENLIDQGMIDAGLAHAEQHPYFKKSFEDYQQYRKNLMSFMVETGYIEPKAAKNMLKVNKNYVPFNRVIEGIGESFAGSGNLQRLKGGSQNLQNVYDNIVQGDFQHIKGSLQAKALRDMYESGLQSQDGSAFFTKIGSDSKLVQTQVDQMATKVSHAMAEFDVTITKNGQVVSGDMSGTVVDQAQISGYFKNHPEELMFWTFGHQPKTTETKVTSFISSRTGKRVWVEIQRDAELVTDMLDNLNGWSLPPGLFGKAVGYAYTVKNMQTVLITSMPQFSIPNLVRDIQTATIISGGKFKPIYHNMLGFASILKHSMGQHSMYTEMLANGGGWAGRARSALDETAGRSHHEMPGHWSKPRLFLSNVLNAYVQIIDSPEMSTRIGFYIQQRGEGKSKREAAFGSREISTDFRKHGSYAPFVMLQRTIPFHGAFVQSVDRDIRAFAEKDGETKFANLHKTESGRVTLEDLKVRMAITAAGFAAITLLLASMNEDEDFYQDLTEDERVRFFHIKVDGEHYQVPKPHGFFSMVMQGVETFVDYLTQKEGADTAKVMLYSLAYNLNSSFFPGIVNPTIELAMNKNFADSPIVPKYLEQASPELQYTERTPQLYVEIGKALGVSPLQARHVSKGYFGYLENFISDTAEMALWNKKHWGERPFKSGSAQYFGKQFLPKDVPYRTRWIEKYYEIRGKAVTAQTDLRQLDTKVIFDPRLESKIEDEATHLFASLNKTFSSVDKEISAMRKDIMFIMYDKDMTAKQKESQINQIRFAKNKIIKNEYMGISSELKEIELKLKKAKNNG